jgi:hypothetical protein
VKNKVAQHCFKVKTRENRDRELRTQTKGIFHYEYGNSTLQYKIREVRKLRVRVAKLENERTPSKNKPTTVGVDTLKTGDRIRITNKIKRPVTWPQDTPWTEERERVGTVTHLIRDQVYFRTDNGRTTWRVSKNVRKIITDERKEFENNNIENK